MPINPLDCSEFQTGCFDPESIRDYCTKLNEVIAQVNQNTLDISSGGGGDPDVVVPFDAGGEVHNIPPNSLSEDCVFTIEGIASATWSVFVNDDGDIKSGSLSVSRVVQVFCNGILLDSQNVLFTSAAPGGNGGTFVLSDTSPFGVMGPFPIDNADGCIITVGGDAGIESGEVKIFCS